MLGFGALTDLVAAPLDNYWHTLYGIDVTLWSPFHIMGTLGGILEGVGILYIFGSEIVSERASPKPPRRYLGFSLLEWGTLAVLAAYMNLTIPALTAFIPVALGPVQLYTYALPLALAGGFQPGQRAASDAQARKRHSDGAPAVYTVALYAGLRAVRPYNKRLAAPYFVPFRRPQADLQSYPGFDTLALPDRRNRT